MTPCLFINKVDRLVLELGLTPSEAEQRLAAIITHANMVVRYYIYSRVIGYQGSLSGTKEGSIHPSKHLPIRLSSD